MPYHVASLHQSASLMVVPLLLVVLLAFCCTPGAALCESRCEQSIPDLVRLREMWADSFTRVGSRRISFEHFLLSLVRVPENGDRGKRRIRNIVLRIVGRYQDCVIACEHQFSKRSSERPRSRPSRAWLRSTSGAGSRSRSKAFSRLKPFLEA